MFGNKWIELESATNLWFFRYTSMHVYKIPNVAWQTTHSKLFLFSFLILSPRMIRKARKKDHTTSSNIKVFKTFIKHRFLASYVSLTFLYPLVKFYFLLVGHYWPLAVGVSKSDFTRTAKFSASNSNVGLKWASFPHLGMLPPVKWNRKHSIHSLNNC